MHHKGLTFKDVTLVPASFSLVRKRKDVDPFKNILGIPRLPLISSNMSSVWSNELASEVVKAGGISIMHRFCTIEENVQMFKNCSAPHSIWGSVGVGKTELERAEALYKAGCHVLVLDVANAAAIHVVDQFKALKELLPLAVFVVGNFDHADQIKEFVYYSKGYVPDFFKVGIGPGSACLTTVTTGVGTPGYSCLKSCVSTGYPIIMDGGIKTTGDFCKAIAAGAVAVIMGKNFAACEESGAPTEGIGEHGIDLTPSEYQFEKEQYNLGLLSTKPVAISKLYRGSASQSSYVDQGKTDYYRTPEGDEYHISVTGTVAELMQRHEGALRSSMSYMNAFDLEEYKKNAEFLEITSEASHQAGSHGKE